MREFECAFCGVTFIVNNGKKDRKYCSQSCSSKAARGVEYYQVDMSYDWERLPTEAELYVCRYNEGAVCSDRNCGKCGFNPEVARLRIEKIRKRMEEEDGAERISEETR